MNRWRSHLEVALNISFCWGEAIINFGVVVNESQVLPLLLSKISHLFNTHLLGLPKKGVKRAKKRHF